MGHGDPHDLLQHEHQTWNHEPLPEVCTVNDQQDPNPHVGQVRPVKDLRWKWQSASRGRKQTTHTEKTVSVTSKCPLRRTNVLEQSTMRQISTCRTTPVSEAVPFTQPIPGRVVSRYSHRLYSPLSVIWTETHSTGTPVYTCLHLYTPVCLWVCAYTEVKGVCGGVHQCESEDGAAHNLVQQDVLIQRKHPHHPRGPEPGQTAPQHQHLETKTPPQHACAEISAGLTLILSCDTTLNHTMVQRVQAQ